MKSYINENSLTASVKARFPAEAVLTDEWLIQRGWDPAGQDGMAYVWLEAFADRTTEAIFRRDAPSVQTHTEFIADQYRAAPEALRAIVDVAYAENIMWNASDDDKAWAWQFIALEIRQFHEAVWGHPAT